MIKALVEMTRQMWKNRCDCLHGHTTQQQMAKRKAKLKEQVEWWFLNRHLVPEISQYLFRIGQEILYEKRSPYYIEKWIDTLECIKIQAVNDIPVMLVPTTRDEDTEGTWSSHELEEYLVDVNNGMEIEGAMAEAGNNAVNNESADVGDSEEITLTEGSAPLEVEYDENERVDLTLTGSQEMEKPINQCGGSGSGMRHLP